MASGDTLLVFTPQANTGPNWLYVAYTSGSVEPSKGDTIWGDTSNANAVLEYLVLNSGSWAGGDAAGYMLFSNWNGTAWTSGENWTKNTTTAANNGTLTSTPVACYGQLDTLRQDTPCISFDASVNEVALFVATMPDAYDGGGVTLTVGFTSTTTGNTVWAGFFKSLTDDVDNLSNVGTDPSGLKVFAAPQASGTVAAASVAGEVKYFTVAFTDGAQMDSVAAGEYFQLLLMRDAQNSNDTLAADAFFVFAFLKET